MNIHVTFRNLPASDALRDHATAKAKKIMKYLIDPVDIHIVFRVEKIRQVAEMTIQSKNFTCHALEASPDMYTSLDKVVLKIETQVRKHKEKVKNHKMEGKTFKSLESSVPAVE